MVKVRWTGEPRELADPQIEVKRGDEFDVPAAVANSFAEQGLAERADTKKEND